ncbi:MAG: hypothetical protein NC311_07815 [Muribaculaceae bacterium]|nr:hypothetical protein [Muribaculaceae bacterium]
MQDLLIKIVSCAKGKGQFSAPELQNELNLGYRELTEALKTLRGNGAIRFIGGTSYVYDEPKKDESQNEDKDDALLTRMKILEMRRQEIIRLKQAEMKNSDEETEAEEEDGEETEANIDGEEGESYNEYDNGAINSYAFLDEAESCVNGDRFEIYGSLRYPCICAKDLKFSNGEKAEFFIRHGTVIELCDGGITTEWMQRKPGFGYKRTMKTLQKSTDGETVRIDDRGQLIVKVPDLSELSLMYYYFYWLIESLIA